MTIKKQAANNLLPTAELTMGEVENSIKIRVPGESFWAVAIPDRPFHAEVRNICFEEGLFLNDIVQINKNGDVLRVVERKWKQKSLVRYTPTTKEACAVVAEQLKSTGGQVEGFLPGILAVMHNEDLSIPELKLNDGTRVETLVSGPTTKRYGG
jgi:hypothetical protein